MREGAVTTDRTQPPTDEAGMGTSALIRNQIRVLDIAQGFFQSDIIFALLKLRVFERLDGATKTAAELASEIGGRADYLQRLLEAGRSLKLLEGDGKRYRLSPLSQSVLAPSAGENYLGNWMRWLEYVRSATTNLDQAVMTGTKTIDGGAHLGGNKQDTREFVLAMHNYATVRGRDLAESLDTSGCTSMLDLACGPGTYAFNLGLKNPNLALYLLDFPPILEVAREVQERYNLPNPVHYLPQDAVASEITGEYDLILVSNMLQMLGEPVAKQLLARLFKVTRKGGSLVVQGQFLEDPSTAAPQRWPVVVDLLQMVMTPHGRNHTISETAQWLRDAGFSRVETPDKALLSATSYVRGYRNS